MTNLPINPVATSVSEREQTVSVWDRTTRAFHWLNLICVLGQIGIGTVILYAGDLGVSTDGKIALKTLHVWIGYVFILNLAWRLIWGFLGGPYSRWSAVLPGGHGYWSSLASSVKHVFSRTPETEIGHSAMGRLAVTVLLSALFVQGVSGLILAGTDVYMPPFGGYFAEWVASPDLDPSQVKPYAAETVNEASYKEMRAFRDPVITTHLNMYYVLLVLILLHVSTVVMLELRKGGNIISAMVTGRKTIHVGTELGEKPMETGVRDATNSNVL